MNRYELTVYASMALAILGVCAYALSTVFRVRCPEWREIQPGEILREGDEWSLDGGRWQATQRAGEPALNLTGLTYRRRVEEDAR